MNTAFALLVIFSATLAIPAVVLGSECLLSLLPLRRRRTGHIKRPRVAVVVPAHDEEEGISETVRSIAGQLLPGDRLLVVADNCSDRTAQRARDAGATVWERQDDSQRGKGYAIRFAWARLGEDPPEVVINIDADSVPAPGCIDHIARLAAYYGRPVQAAHLMSSRSEAVSVSAVSALALMVKNYARPRGLQRIGLPCLLGGSGMAFPWRVVEEVPHPDNHIVEDLRFTTDLAIAGKAPLPCMETAVYSVLPAGMSGFVSQRTRWEHGHLSTIVSEVPRLFLALCRRPRLSLLAVMLELGVPPLGFLVLVLFAAIGLLVAASWVVGSWWPAAIAIGAAMWAAAGITAVWTRFGREVLPARELLTVPRYLVAKLPMYGRFFTSREVQWVRTERDHGAAIGEPHVLIGGTAPGVGAKADL